MLSNRRKYFCVLVISLVLLIVFGMHARYAFAASPSTEGDAENIAKHALDAAKVSAFDGSMTYVSQETIAKPVGGADHEIRYTISGPGEGVKSNVQFRIYASPAAAAAHANPDRNQQMQEVHENDMPSGQYRTYHSNLSGSDLAKDVPETFHCVAVTGKETWSRCYYYGGGDSNVVVVGTTSSGAANEAILITAMGAQGLGTAK